MSEYYEENKSSSTVFLRTGKEARYSDCIAVQKEMISAVDTSREKSVNREVWERVRNFEQRRKRSD